MDDLAAPHPQPNFPEVANSFNAIAMNMRLCDNLPQLRLEGIEQTVRTGFANMNQQFANLNTEIYNQQVRRENSQRHGENIDLIPLRSFTLVPPQDITNFPTSAAAIDAMTASTLNALLQHLGQPTQGGVAEKKRAVKRQVGVHIVRTARHV